MYMKFETLSDNSKVWIYQSNRTFREDEVELLKQKLEFFVNNWKRHGKDLKASYKIKYEQFIILAIDENSSDISGCSIDAAVNLIKQFETSFDLDLTNKLNISFRDQETINIVNFSDFQQYAKSKKITGDTVVFNNLVTTKAEFEKNWEVPAVNSWHKRFLEN